MGLLVPVFDNPRLPSDVRIRVSSAPVLDPTPNSTLLNQDAVRGYDALNNMEQVTIDNPPAGNYTLSIDGYSIPYGPQQYYVTYEFIDSDVELTYPIGGEGLVPGETEYLRWDSDHQGGVIDICLLYTSDAADE